MQAWHFSNSSTITEVIFFLTEISIFGFQVMAAGNGSAASVKDADKDWVVFTYAYD